MKPSSRYDYARRDYYFARTQERGTHLAPTGPAFGLWVAIKEAVQWIATSKS